MRNVSLILLTIFSIATMTNAALIDTIDFVTIENPGNTADTRTDANPSGAGTVNYTYRIGKYEITNAQWDAFTSAAGTPTGTDDAYNQSSAYAGADLPVTNVSWLEAAQFCNFLTSGDKSQGVYQFSGDNTNPGSFLGIDRDNAMATYDRAFALPTENEWYKAAYFTGSGYSTYAFGSDTAPNAGTQTNYDWFMAAPWAVGSGEQEQNETYDIMGNVFEWNEQLKDNNERYLRGGTFYGGAGYNEYLKSSERGYYNQNTEDPYLGFRIVEVPEPATIILLTLGAITIRKRLA